MTKLKPHIRWMIRCDMPTIQSIEAASFEYPWQEEDFNRHLRQHNSIGMVAEYDEQVVGFMVYECYKHRIELPNFAVHPKFRRRGVATHMVAKLTGKLSVGRRTEIALKVKETNLPAQLFFRESGFRAVSVLRDSLEGTSEDAYRMIFTLQSAPLEPGNRIRHLLR